MLNNLGLFASLELALESSKCVDVTESCRSSLVLDSRCLLLCLLALASSCCSLLLSLLLLLCCILEDAAVRKDDSLSLLVELDYLELELLISGSLCAILLNKVLWSCEALNTVRQ